MEYTIPQLEALSIALSENNKMDDDDKTDTKKDKPFEDNDSMSGMDAINGLKAMGMI